MEVIWLLVVVIQISISSGALFEKTEAKNVQRPQVENFLSSKIFQRSSGPRSSTRGFQFPDLQHAGCLWVSIETQHQGLAKVCQSLSFPFLWDKGHAATVAFRLTPTVSYCFLSNRWITTDLDPMPSKTFPYDLLEANIPCVSSVLSLSLVLWRCLLRLSSVARPAPVPFRRWRMLAPAEANRREDVLKRNTIVRRILSEEPKNHYTKLNKTWKNYLNMLYLAERSMGKRTSSSFVFLWGAVDAICCSSKRIEIDLQLSWCKNPRLCSEMPTATAEQVGPLPRCGKTGRRLVDHVVPRRFLDSSSENVFVVD